MGNRWEYTLVMIDCQGTDTSLTHLAPGLTVILEVERSAGEEPTIFTLAEAAESRIDGLIAACLWLRQKYGS